MSGGVLLLLLLLIMFTNKLTLCTVVSKLDLSLKLINARWMMMDDTVEDEWCNNFLWESHYFLLDTTSTSTTSTVVLRFFAWYRYFCTCTACKEGKNRPKSKFKWMNLFSSLWRVGSRLCVKCVCMCVLGSLFFSFLNGFKFQVAIIYSLLSSFINLLLLIFHIDYCWF